MGKNILGSGYKLKKIHGKSMTSTKEEK